MIFTKHPDGSITKKRERLSEFFVLEVREGEMVPRFFLPVYRLPRQHAMVAWLAPLAPFALIVHAFKEACISVWMDHVDWISYLRSHNAKRRREREASGGVVERSDIASADGPGLSIAGEVPGDLFGRDRALIPLEVQADLTALQKLGLQIVKISPWHFRLGGVLDIFWTRQRYHDIKQNTRGDYNDLVSFAKEYLGHRADVQTL